MSCAQNWYQVARNDARARQLADRHYSRQHIGANEFCPPGDNIVLIVPSPDFGSAQALWVSHRPNPKAHLAMPRQDGMDYWDNPYFRNESSFFASELIREALAITLKIWGRPLPEHGFHSFVDAKKLQALADAGEIKPIRRRGKPAFGFVFEKAGFVACDELTKVRKLIRFILPSDRLEQIEPLCPQQEQTRIFDLVQED